MSFFVTLDVKHFIIHDILLIVITVLWLHKINQKLFGAL